LTAENAEHAETKNCLYDTVFSVVGRNHEITKATNVLPGGSTAEIAEIAEEEHVLCELGALRG
jgi:hypothetical protein